MSRASIVKDIRYTAIVIDNEPKLPGTYEVNKGDKIKYYGLVKNTGSRGKIWIALVEEGREDEPLAYNVGYVNQNDCLNLPEGTITVLREMKLKFIAGHGELGYYQDDEWGCGE